MSLRVANSNVSAPVPVDTTNTTNTATNRQNNEENTNQMTCVICEFFFSHFALVWNPFLWYFVLH